jgi:hypothetical protein
MSLLAKGIVAGAAISAGCLVFLISASAADIVNKQLAACLAEKKPMGEVNSCGKKWKIGSSSARLAADGNVSVEVSGLVLDDVSVGDANGSPDGVDAIAVAVLCDGKVAAQADPVPLSSRAMQSSPASSLCLKTADRRRSSFVRDIKARSAAGSPAPVNKGNRPARTRLGRAYLLIGAASSISFAALRSFHKLAGIAADASATFAFTSSGFTAPSTTETTAGWANANWIAAWRSVTLCFLQIASIAFTLSTTALEASA